MREEGGDVTKLPRFQRECLHAGLTGPYPFAKGPLVVYSHVVASTLVAMPELAADEAFALGARKREPLRAVFSGLIYKAKQVRRRATRVPA